MSYRKRARNTYSMPKRTISPSTQTQFQSDFNKGYDQALEKATSLEKDGWNFSPVTLMQSKADEKMANFKSEGYDVDFIPVAEWMGEKMGIVLFREQKTKTPTPSSAPPSSAPTPTSQEEFSILDFARAEARFIKHFKNAFKRDEAGVYMDPSRTMALVLPDAKPDAALPKVARDHANDTPFPSLINGDVLKKKTKPYVQIGQKIVAVKYLRVGLSVLGNNAEAVECGSGDPFILRKNNINVLIAPAEPAPENVEFY